MSEQENRAAMERLMKSLEIGEPEYDVFSPDCVWEWPQSGERIEGLANYKAITANYPGMPTMQPRRLYGSHDVWIAQATLDYGGEIAEAVSIAEFSDGRIHRSTEYFAAPFEPPEWRAPWVQLMG